MEQIPQGNACKRHNWETTEMFNRMKAAVIGGVAAASLVFSAAAWADVESKDPIKLTLHDWTGQLLTTKIMGEVLKKAGYNIEYVQADYIAQFAGLESGDLHIAMEMWETTGKQAMDESLATGKTVDLDGCQGRVVVSAVYEGEMPGPARLEGAERLRRGFLHPGNGAQGPLSGRAGDLGRVR
jgi:glycine betaine/proline transport system substrate-binding protein